MSPTNLGDLFSRIFAIIYSHNYRRSPKYSKIKQQILLYCTISSETTRFVDFIGKKPTNLGIIVIITITNSSETTRNWLILASSITITITITLKSSSYIIIKKEKSRPSIIFTLILIIIINRQWEHIIFIIIFIFGYRDKIHFSCRWWLYLCDFSDNLLHFSFSLLLVWPKFIIIFGYRDREKHFSCRQWL